MAAKKDDFAQQQSLFNKELKEGAFHRVYLLCGEQAYLRIQNRDRLREKKQVRNPMLLRLFCLKFPRQLLWSLWKKVPTSEKNSTRQFRRMDSYSTVRI